MQSDTRTLRWGELDRKPTFFSKRATPVCGEGRERIADAAPPHVKLETLARCKQAMPLSIKEQGGGEKPNPKQQHREYHSPNWEMTSFSHGAHNVALLGFPEPGTRAG